MTKVIFFGTPDYILPVPQALKDTGYNLVAVVTQPEKPVGRRQLPTPSPVATWAKNHNIPVITNVTLLHNSVTKSKPEIGILAAYGKIIPQAVIDAFPKGILNIHPSLLPKYRGATPIEAAIASGDKETGVTVIKLDSEIDHGPILAQETEEILPEDNQHTLRERLFKRGAKMIVETIALYLSEKLQPKEQGHSKATYVTMLKKEHGFIPPGIITSALQGDLLEPQNWNISFIKNYKLKATSYQLNCFIRSISSWPGAYTNVKVKNENVKRLKIIKAHVEEERLILDEVQLEGKNPVTWEQFRQGYPEAKFV